MRSIVKVPGGDLLLVRKQPFVLGVQEMVCHFNRVEIGIAELDFEPQHLSGQFLRVPVTLPLKLTVQGVDPS
jgi:hypothetical protein